MKKVLAGFLIALSALWAVLGFALGTQQSSFPPLSPGDLGDMGGHSILVFGVSNAALRFWNVNN